MPILTVAVWRFFQGMSAFVSNNRKTMRSCGDEEQPYHVSVSVDGVIGGL